MRRFLQTFVALRHRPVAVVGLALVLFWFAAALLAPVLAPFDPLTPLKPFAKPGAAHGDALLLLGADTVGRDILSRVLFGARAVLLYAIGATLLAYAVGVAAGLAAGYYRGRVDTVLSFGANVVLSFPVLVLYILILTTVGASGLNILLAVTVASAPGIMRVVRGLTLELREREFVAAAKLRGDGAFYIMLVEILPNVRGPLLVDACLRFGYVIITIGVLGFLGLGLPPPVPDWGSMIKEARQVALAFPHMTLAPAVAISSLVLGFNLLADGLRDLDGRG
ncbi:MAG: ABC transporter permease [Alphaproteobacteria bacterium]|nr:ABC transporter permease [Alphaproteobacteria bacterium]